MQLDFWTQVFIGIGLNVLYFGYFIIREYMRK